MKKLLVLAITVAAVASTAVAQLSFPFAVSQRGTTVQKIGVTTVEIDYGRPGVNDREIWGKLVPYDQIWRAGANENTTFKVSTNVKINGKDLPAGKYGLHMIPTANKWTVIFNKDHEAWGSYFYDESQDALRVEVTPKSSGFTELLTYTIPIVQADQATVQLEWEKLAVPFTVSVDLTKTTQASLRNQLTGLAGFTLTNYVQAASWIVQNNGDLALAREWAARANNAAPTFASLMLGAKLAEMDGKGAEAKSMRAKAIDMANNNELNNYGYQLLQSGKVEEAIPVFVKNTERFPKDPNVWDSLGEAYATANNKSKAKECFKKSLSMNPPDNVRQNSESWLKKLEE